MRINQVQLEKLQKIYQQHGEKTRNHSQDIQQDKMDISSQSRLLKEIQTGLEEASAVRDQKVEVLKGQIESGNYRVNSRELASKILNEIDRK